MALICGFGSFAVESVDQFAASHFRANCRMMTNKPFLFVFDWILLRRQFSFLYFIATRRDYIIKKASERERQLR